MPRLPGIGPTPGPGSLNLPRPGPEAFGADAFRAVGQVGDVFAEIDQQNSEIELAKLKAEYDVGVADLKTSLAENPDLGQHETEFEKGIRKLQKDTIGRAERGPVKKILGGYFQATDAVNQSDVKTNVTKLRLQRDIADLDRLGETYSALIARTEDPDQQRADAVFYETLVTRAEQRGTIDSVEAETRRRNFRQKIQFGLAMRDAREDPVGTLENLSVNYPLLDVKSMETVIARAMREEDKLDKDLEKAEKERTDALVLEAAIQANSGNLSAQEWSNMARANGIPEEDYRKILNDIERGGTTDPDVVITYEAAIRSGQPITITQIMGRRDISAADKSKLFDLIDQKKSADHFSSSPQYQQAVKEINTAMQKGFLEQITFEERQRQLYLYQNLWDRVKAGEDPILVGRELIDRIPREEQINPPPVKPSYPDKQSLVSDFKNGKISDKKFSEELELFDQLERYQGMQQKGKESGKMLDERLKNKVK